MRFAIAALLLLMDDADALLQRCRFCLRRMPPYRAEAADAVPYIAPFSAAVSCFFKRLRSDDFFASDDVG